MTFTKVNNKGMKKNTGTHVNLLRLSGVRKYVKHNLTVLTRTCTKESTTL